MASDSSIRLYPGCLAETSSYKSCTRIPAQHGGQTKGRTEPQHQRLVVLLPVGLEAARLGVADLSESP